MFRTETPKIENKKHDQNLHNNYVRYNCRAGHMFFKIHNLTKAYYYKHRYIMIMIL